MRKYRLYIEKRRMGALNFISPVVYILNSDELQQVFKGSQNYNNMNLFDTREACDLFVQQYKDTLKENMKPGERLIIVEEYVL